MSQAGDRDFGRAVSTVVISRALTLGLLAVLLLVGCDVIEDHFGTCGPPLETESFTFEVEWTRVVQGNQTLTNLAPVLASRPAGVEVLLTLVDGPLRAYVFDIHATVEVLVDGGPVGSLNFALGCVRSERSALRGTIPGAWIRRGTELLVTVHSASTNVSVPDETFVVKPIVAEVPVLEVTVVPLVVGGQFPDTSRAVYVSWLEAARRTFAIDRYDLEVHSPLDLGLDDACDLNTKFRALQELWFFRTTQASERFFVGVLPCVVGGVALTPGFVQVTSPGEASTRTFLHELGHNFGLRHAPCGGAPVPDPSYPYSGGVLGLPGFDAANEAWIAATAADLMGYCQGAWLSDYHYARSARYRMFQERPPVLDTLDDATWPVSVLVQGEVRPDGTIRVTHAVRRFEPSDRRITTSTDTTDTVAIEVLGRGGKVLVRRDAYLVDVDHVETRLFSARIGMAEASGLVATAVRVAYGEERSSRVLVDRD